MSVSKTKQKARSQPKANPKAKEGEKQTYPATGEQPSSNRWERRRDVQDAARLPDNPLSTAPRREAPARAGSVSVPSPEDTSLQEAGLTPADTSQPYRYDGPPIAASQVASPAGMIPFQPPPEVAEESDFSEDNPLNPKGSLSPQWPQQATPLASLQGVEDMEEALDHRSPEHEPAGPGEIPPDNPLNPKGTPDILVAEDTPETITAREVNPQDVSLAEPNPGYTDNPLNPRGVPDYLADGSPNSTAADSQKIQDPYPKRENALPHEISVSERVSAGQNRQPPLERVP